VAEHQQPFVFPNDPQELRFVDRFGDEIVDLHRVASGPRLLVIGRGQNDHRDSRPAVRKLSHPPDDV
jgi:hypothetical protein